MHSVWFAPPNLNSNLNSNLNYNLNSNLVAPVLQCVLLLMWRLLVLNSATCL